jgi:hypothetical protein
MLLPASLNQKYEKPRSIDPTAIHINPAISSSMCFSTPGLNFSFVSFNRCSPDNKIPDMRLNGRENFHDLFIWRENRKQEKIQAKQPALNQKFDELISFRIKSQESTDKITGGFRYEI